MRHSNNTPVAAGTRVVQLVSKAASSISKILFAPLVLLAVTVSAAAPEKAMIPFSGKHFLVQHKFNEGYNAGKGNHIALNGRGLTDTVGHEGAAAAPAVYLSEEIQTKFGANEMVLTWNADVPVGAWINIKFRVAAPGLDWSSWFDMGNWGSGPAAERNTEDEAFGKLKVDQLVTKVKFHTIQYMVEFHGSPEGKHPLLRMVTISYSHTGGGEIDKQLMAAAGGKSVSLKAPWMSQLRPEDVEDEAMRAAGACAPTSMTMILNYYGVGVKITEVGRRAFDPVARIYGNWAFLAATAADYGFSSWVHRFNNWTEARKLIESGAPVIISIAYPKGTFKDDPEKMSNGHLLVVRGFTKNGDVICNDPGTAFPGRGDGVVYKWQELGEAFLGHGGVGIIVKPPVKYPKK